MRIFLPVVLGVIALAACQPQTSQPAGLTDADRAAINTVRESYVRSDLAGDAAGIAALYAADGMLMENHGSAILRPAAIQESYNALVRHARSRHDRIGRGPRT